MPPRIPPHHYDWIDFASLALQYPAFARKLKPNGQLDFSDPEAVRQLTISLLDRDFGLTVTLPPDRLCPPVPNRFNYIVFLQRLLDSTSASFRDSHDPGRQIAGVDIGTGASAIYPLLGTQQFANWTFFATELDAASWASAAENISRNGLAERIKLLDTSSLSSTQLIPTSTLFNNGNNQKIDFLMTNPPFYSSTAEMAASAQLKARPPNSSCTGSIAMLGKLSSLAPLVTLIHEFHSQLHPPSPSTTPTTTHHNHNTTAPNYAVTEFIQGQRTRRWCLAWSWLSLRPPVAVARGAAPARHLLPLVTEFDFSFAAHSVAAVAAVVNRAMQELLSDDKAETVVKTRWMQGFDGVLFESFCGWLKRKVESSIRPSH
ncbi:hypothetical protein DV735_g3352, partial [Chaetothyriales sp. CBS 134920]